MEVLNKLARERSNLQLIAQIHQENPQIREIQQENRQLKVCLEDHQHALEHIMQKYREHTQKKIKETKLDFTSTQNTEQVEIIQKQSQKIQEMAAVMRKACEVDQDKINKEHEYLSQLITENKVSRTIETGFNGIFYLNYSFPGITRNAGNFPEIR